MDKDEIIKELQEKNTKFEEQLNKYLLKNKNYYEKFTIYIHIIFK